MSAAGLSPQEVEVFARGLFHLSQVDGVDPREENLIKQFLTESETGLSFEALKELPFSATEAAGVLEASYLRRIFVKAAIALVKADGTYSDAERRALGEIADAFGLSNTEFGEIEQEAARRPLE